MKIEFLKERADEWAIGFVVSRGLLIVAIGYWQFDTRWWS